jgi:hypothetical protein
LSTPGELRLRKNNTVAAVENFMTSQEDLQIWIKKKPEAESEIATSCSQSTTALSSETRQSLMNLGFKAGDRFLKTVQFFLGGAGGCLAVSVYASVFWQMEKDARQLTNFSRTQWNYNFENGLPRAVYNYRQEDTAIVYVDETC